MTDAMGFMPEPDQHCDRWVREMRAEIRAEVATAAKARKAAKRKPTFRIGQHVKSEYGRRADGSIEWRYGTIKGRVKGQPGWYRVQYWDYVIAREVHGGDLRPMLG